MSERTVIRCLLMINLFLGLFYLLAKPPWQGYDEPQHVEVVMLLKDGHSHPIFNRSGWWNVADSHRYALEKEIIESMLSYRFWTIHNLVPPSQDMSFKAIFKGANEYHQPPLYYVICAALCRFLPTDSPLAVMYFCRFLSLLMVLLSLWLFVRWLPLVFPNSPDKRLTALAILTLAPMHANLAASVNNDALIHLVGMALLGLLFHIRSQKKLSISSLAGLTVVATIGMLTKATFSVGLVLILILLYQLLLRDSPGGHYLKIAVKTGIVFVLSVATFLFHFSDKFNVYQLLRLPLRVLESLHFSAAPALFSPRCFWGFAQYFYKSAVGVFVYGHEYLAIGWYGLFALVLAVACYGWFTGCRSHSESPVRRDIYQLIAASLLLITLQTYIKYFVNGAYFGDAHFRYSAMVYSAWACLGAAGLCRVMGTFLSDRTSTVKIVLAVGVIFHSIVIMWYFLPLYYL